MDASDYALGAVITQSGHPVVFHSKNFKDIVIRYSTNEKKLYAIMQALKQWRHYILGKETVILTDHEPLQFSLSSRYYKQLDNSSGLITYNNFSW